MFRSFLLELGLASALLLGVRFTAPTPFPIFAVAPSNPTSPTPSANDAAAVALAAVQTTYRTDLLTLASAVDALDAAAAGADPEGATSMDSLRARHFAARRTFKNVEWLLAHRDEATVRTYLNGAPLPSVMPKIPEVVIRDPAGLQPIEEIVYDEALDTASAKTLRKLTTDLGAVVRQTEAFERGQRLTHAQVWGAARYGLIRIFTMGVTGFDTPGSGLALTESAVALDGIATGIAAYAPLMDASVAEALAAGFAEGRTQLLASDFDSFDRVAFYRKVIAPLYRQLYEAQRALGIETPDETEDRPAQHNYDAGDLFADDFLNDFVFAGQPAVDPLFSRKRDLGERLFYDVNLSSSGKLSCASCHNPERAFTDGVAKSLGSDGQPVFRNAPTLVGAVFAERYFADLREPQLSRQIRHVIQDKHEFATDYLTLINQLGTDSSYRQDFNRAYADVDSAYRLSAYSLGDALASFVRTLHSNSSPVDRYLRGETAQMAPEVRRGMNLFMGKAVCATCHFAPTWSGLVPPYYRESESEVLGVPTVWPLPDTASAKTRYLDPDFGRFVSGRPEDGAPFFMFSFKTPTVRNAALTAPYMHNGAIGSLREVVEFYKVGGGAGLGMEIPHQTLPFDELELSDGEVADLVAFMEALTDQD